MTPPKAKPASERVRKGLEKLAANEAKMQSIRDNAESSKYFDGSAPSTRMRREQVRTYYEQFIETCYGLTDTKDVWHVDTFVARTKQFLEGVINVSMGKFEERIKTSSLWCYKHALYWWAAVLVKDFSLIWHQWHVEVTRHIHQLAVQEPLSTQSWKKHNLSDSELILIFRHIEEQRHHVANFKQHWAALILTWLTAARPGSFTVTKGYEKGASLGLPGKFRAVDETLRWSDIDFVNMPGGVAVRITFQHNKGQRNPNLEGSKQSSAARTFLFLPSMGERLEFDLPIILFGIAYERGLFVQTLEEILDQEPSDLFLEKHTAIDQQAVFVAATLSGQLDTTKPMTIQALNPKLKQLCTSVGLIERNTYYSLRRTAIIETRRNHDTEKAKDLAFHVPNANSLFFYDNIGFGDIDMQQFRFGSSESMSRQEVQKYFSQANLARWRPAQDEEMTLVQALERTIKDRLPDDERYIAKELELKAVYEEVRIKLQEMQTAGDIPETVKIPTGYSARDGAKYKALASQYEAHELTDKMEKQLASRKSLYRSIRLELRKKATEEVRQRHKAVLTESQKQANRVTSERGFEPQAVRNVEVTGLGRSMEEIAFLGDSSDLFVADEEDNDGVDADALEHDDMNSREEPDCWADLAPVVHVQIGSGEVSARTLQTRRDFLLKWINHKDSVVAQSNLLCLRCQIDDTMDDAAKKRRFTLYRLNTHMRGSVHSRESQIRRALKLDSKDNTSMIPCPVCKLLCKGTRQFMKHLKDDHPEQLWLDVEDDSDEQDTGDECDFEGFSDSGDEESEFEGFSSPASAYTGKGKARAD